MGGFRTLIALSMAMIGTVIIDQNMFQDDIEKRKIMTIGDEVKRIFPIRAEEYRRQLAEIDSTIVSKENEKRQIIDEISKNPFVKIVEQDISYDTAKRKSTNVSIRKLPNPQASLLEPMDKMILALHTEKAKRDSSLIGLRQQIEGEIKANVGFLDELEVMFSLLSESGISFGAWLIWFIFLLALELFILVSKIGEVETDYDRRMQQQMELHYRRIDLLKQQAE